MFLSILYGFFAFVFVLSVLVFVHEYGHYLGCVLCNIRVESFSIGMWKEIWGWTDKRGVRWRVSLLPIGGYVKMYGDADASSARADKELLARLTEEEKKTIIHFQPAWKKFLVTFFGPAFNLVFATLLFTAMHRFNGILIAKPIINDVLADSPAFNILKKDDLILKINDKKIESFNQIGIVAMMSNGEPLHIKILRDDKELEVEVVPQIRETKDAFGNDVKLHYIGVISKTTERQDINILEAFLEAIKTTWRICKNSLIMLWQIIIGQRNADGLGGPLKIAKYSMQSFRGGIGLVVYLMAMLSANLGLMNLLPIPVLDGGNLLFLLIEMVIRRSIPEKIQEKLLQAGLGILLFMMVFATLNDIRGFL